MLDLGVPEPADGLRRSVVADDAERVPEARASHAAPKKYVSGNINNLECDKSGLTPSIPLRATVTRADPRKVVLSATAQHDDELYTANKESTLSTLLQLGDIDNFEAVSAHG